MCCRNISCDPSRDPSQDPSRDGSLHRHHNSPADLEVRLISLFNSDDIFAGGGQAPVAEISTCCHGFPNNVF